MLFELAKLTDGGIMDKNNYEYLKGLALVGCRDISLLSKKWYNSEDTMISVARILEEEGILNTVDQAITFFEKPYKWERDIQDLIREYEGVLC